MSPVPQIPDTTVPLNPFSSQFRAEWSRIIESVNRFEEMRTYLNILIMEPEVQAVSGGREFFFAEILGHQTDAPFGANNVWKYGWRQTVLGNLALNEGGWWWGRPIDAGAQEGLLDSFDGVNPPNQFTLGARNLAEARHAKDQYASSPLIVPGVDTSDPPYAQSSFAPQAVIAGTDVMMFIDTISVEGLDEPLRFPWFNMPIAHTGDC